MPTNKHYWNYFLSMEKELINLSQYIEFCPANFDTYSIELVKIILAAGSEIDVILKQTCKSIDPTSTAKNITEYATEILTAFPDITTIEVFIPKYELVFKPWDGWAAANSPQWWKDYNGVKHQRDTDYPNATLKNALQAVCGLFVAEIVLYRFINPPTTGTTLVINATICENDLDSDLFELDDKYDPNTF